MSERVEAAVSDRVTTARLREIAEQEWPLSDEEPALCTRRVWQERRDEARELLVWREAGGDLLHDHYQIHERIARLVQEIPDEAPHD